MILQALVAYYEALHKQGKISKPGWTAAKISYALNIDEQGKLLGVIPLTREELRGKKTVEVPQIMGVPEGAERHGKSIVSHFLWDNSRYMLGIGTNGCDKDAQERFEAMKTFQVKFLEGLSGKSAVSVKAFFETWKPENGVNNIILKPYMKEITNIANLVFYVSKTEKFAHEDEEIKEKWDKNYLNSMAGENGQCLITGEITTIARLHPAIKGLPKAQPAGVKIVSFNETADESYGKKQGMNAPVSEYATFAYTTALNHLIADKKHTQNFGDTTMVYWAKTAETQYADCYGLANFDPNSVSEGELATIFTNIGAGKRANFADLPLDPQNEFYILGLSPNAARLSVRFFYHNKFGAIMDNLQKYYDESNIVKPSYENITYLPLWDKKNWNKTLLGETINKNITNAEPNPLLMGAVMRSILTGSRYPQALYENILLRVKADQDKMGKGNSRKITWSKVAVLKACLRRNYNNKEEATVSLNEESKDKAYVLGRLFAVLEHLQESANPGVNSTIKDRYFNSACTSPSLIFPVLLKLANYHLRKIEEEKGKQVYFEKQIGGIEDKLEMNEHPIPMHLGLEEQGKFILGYYHQVQKRFEKKEDK